MNNYYEIQSLSLISVLNRGIVVYVKEGNDYVSIDKDSHIALSSQFYIKSEDKKNIEDIAVFTFDKDDLVFQHASTNTDAVFHSGHPIYATVKDFVEVQVSPIANTLPT